MRRLPEDPGESAQKLDLCFRLANHGGHPLGHWGARHTEFSGPAEFGQGLLRNTAGPPGG